MKVREGIGMLERGLPLARSPYPAGSDALQTRHAELAGCLPGCGRCAPGTAVLRQCRRDSAG